jgi:hypothetical protein
MSGTLQMTVLKICRKTNGGGRCIICWNSSIGIMPGDDLYNMQQDF